MRAGARSIIQTNTPHATMPCIVHRATMPVIVHIAAKRYLLIAWPTKPVHLLLAVVLPCIVAGFPKATC